MRSHFCHILGQIDPADGGCPGGSHFKGFGLGHGLSRARVSPNGMFQKDRPYPRVDWLNFPRQFPYHAAFWTPPIRGTTVTSFLYLTV